MIMNNNDNGNVKWWNNDINEMIMKMIIMVMII